MCSLDPLRTERWACTGPRCTPGALRPGRQAQWPPGFWPVCRAVWEAEESPRAQEAAPRGGAQRGQVGRSPTGRAADVPRQEARDLAVPSWDTGLESGCGEESGQATGVTEGVKGS